MWLGIDNVWFGLRDNMWLGSLGSTRHISLGPMNCKEHG
jgi:hypothetical protein